MDGIENSFASVQRSRKTRGKEARQRATHADQIRLLLTEEAEYLPLVLCGVSSQQRVEAAKLGEAAKKPTVDCTL
jgi:hypothetical protein